MKQDKHNSITSRVPELTALFPPETAGNDMVADLPIFQKKTKVADALHHVIKDTSAYHTVNYLYVVNTQGQLMGVVSIRELMQASSEATLGSIMVKKPITANPMDPVARVALLSLRHQLKMIPIVDHKNRLLGAFSSDKLLEILNKEFSNDLLRLSGVSFPRKHFSFNSVKIFWTRFPWMLFGMLGGLVTGSIIGAFQSSIEAVVLLAAFIPVIMSTGATSANQSAMIFVRNLLHGDIKNRIQYVFNEIKIATLLGVGLSVILYLIIWLFLGNAIFAVVVSFSLFLTIIAGAMIGVITPMLLNRAKLDPAIGTGPFLTIIKDILAMTIYFSVATALLRYFV